MKKPIIIAIVGESGSGKTTLAKHLEDKFKIPTIVSYTTREMREGETDGVEHFFVDNFPYSPNNEKILAYTKFGGHDYWTTHDQVSNNNFCTYVIDEKGLITMKKKYEGIYDIISVYIDCPIWKRGQWTPIDRLERDTRRIHIEAEDYYCIIQNIGSLDYLFKDAENKINTLIEKAQERQIWQH
jgi:guanylate kinase